MLGHYMMNTSSRISFNLAPFFTVVFSGLCPYIHSFLDFGIYLRQGALYIPGRA